MKTTIALVLIAFACFNLNCSSASKGRVVETESGQLEAIGLAKNEPDARISAVDQAKEFCSEEQKKPVFREDQLHKGSRKGLRLDLKNLPVIGKVFKDEDKTQVVLGFRCKSSVA